MEMGIMEYNRSIVVEKLNVALRKQSVIDNIIEYILEEGVRGNATIFSGKDSCDLNDPDLFDILEEYEEN